MNPPITGNNARSSASAASASQASAAKDASATEPFAALLAQQLDGLNLLASGDSATGDAAKPMTDDAQNQAVMSGDQPGNPANIIAAIVLAEDRGQKTVGGELIKESRKQRTDGLQLAMDKLPGAQSLSAPPGSAQQNNAAELDALSADAFERMDMSASHTVQSRPGENAAKTIATPGLSDALISKFKPGANAAGTIAAPVLPAAPQNAPIQNGMADIPQTLNAPLGSNGWSNEFSQKISWMGIHQQQVAELHLNPPNLGPLDVVLKISDNQATALFTSAHGAVREAVENALPKLREMLAGNGITLGNVTVSDQPPRDRGAEGFIHRDSGTAAQRNITGNDSGSSELTSAAAQITRVRRHNGMVDTFA